MNLDDFSNNIRQIFKNETVEFVLNGNRDKEGNITINGFNVVQKSGEIKRPAGFKSITEEKT